MGLWSPTRASRGIEGRFVQESDVAAAGDVSGREDERATDAAHEAPGGG